VPTHFSGKGRWVAGEEPKELEFVDGVWCEVVYALDKQLRWIEKNIQPGTKRVQARLQAEELAMKNGDNERVVEARPVRVPPRPLMDPPTPAARGAGPGADQEDFALREWLRCSFGMCMSDRDREVVREAVRERIRPVEEAGKMLEWDWGSERLAVAESCLPSRVAEARRLVAQERSGVWVVGWECVGARAA